MRALFIFLALFFTSTPAVGWEQACLPGQSSLALAMDVDAMGVIHWARVGRLDGALYYGTWAPGGVMSEAIIAENISRSSNFEVRHLGIITHSQGVDVCFPNALASRVEVASLRSGSWARVVVESGIVSKGCDLAFDGATLNIAYAADGVLRLAYRDGGWHAQTIDATEEPVGEMPDLAVTPLGLAVAHRAGGDALRLTWWDGASWLSETPPHSLSNTGHEPALILDGDQVSVYHAVAASTLNVTSDVFVLETRGPLGGPYVTDQILANNLGGALDAARAGDRLDLITRQLSRSALFGSSDGLLIYTNDLMTPEYFFSNGSGDQRILVRAARVAHGPFDLPVFASIEDRSAYLGQPSQSVTCLWRPEDGDQDGLPDEAEASLGTDPDDQDTDGDGRTDGEEVLIDGTDPLNPPACIPVAEVCNNLDDDCDGRIDDDLTRPCYNGPAGTRGVGRCEDGAQSCVAGAWWACAGAVLPTAEICNGVDDDCDGQTDEGIAEVGGDCVGVGVGRCGLGALVCTADGAGLECLLFSPRAEICDGIDDDCDGQTDEGEQSCGVGACARTAPRCLDGADAPCVPGAPAANDATCDGIDDDCDGFTDENAVPRPISCGVGACRATGQRACSHGAWVDTCTPAAPLAANDVTCDGVDDDCDGQIDEDAAPQATACGVGACAATGQRRCLGGAWVDDCLPGAPLAARDLTCDGIDDDCDGQADEETTPQPLSCGVGACAAVGERRCWQGGWVELCEPGLPALEDRSCDGIDDNCDGQVDEGFLPRATACGVGACAALGQLRCVAGVAVDDCAPGAPTGLDEDCDGVDDDCDGATDEGFIGAPISCGEGECFLATTTRCVGGILDARCTPLPPPSAIDERCDGLDEDCDGQIDEEVVASPISCGVGACRALGARRCEAGAWVEACQPGVAAADDATCDGVDDDCDGLI
ncbi:hypothetical protein KJ940_14020, partial [Myxococcota bacterium]|nr:hypothetical protein [Myxococcota bacterium]